MSGPTPMSLGPYAFEALGFGYQDVGRRLSTPWAAAEVGQSMDRDHWTGPKSDEVTIRGVVFDESMGGQDSLDGLAAAAMAGLPLMFVSGSAGAGVISGFFTIQGIDEDRSLHDRGGRARRNAYQIRLKRYIGAAPGPSSLTSLVGLIG